MSIFPLPMFDLRLNCIWQSFLKVPRIRVVKGVNFFKICSQTMTAAFSIQLAWSGFELEENSSCAHKSTMWGSETEYWEAFLHLCNHKFAMWLFVRGRATRRHLANYHLRQTPNHFNHAPSICYKSDIHFESCEKSGIHFKAVKVWIDRPIC